MAAARAVVDASAVVKWVLQDEEARDGALALLDDYAAGAVDLDAPVLLRYETTQALRRAERRARVAEAHIDRAIGYLDAVLITMHTPSPGAALAISRKLNISTYDASYVALAEQLGSPLWTGDERLVRAASASALVRWIGDYTLAGSVG